MVRTCLFALLAVTLLPALAGCSSTATPKTVALYAPKVVVTGALPVGTAEPVISKSGTYPTFGPPITAANAQMEDSQARRLEAEMVALTVSRDTGSITEAEYQRQLIELRRLAATHASSMQTKIGN